MKAINGKLDMSKSYKLVDVIYGEAEEMACSCCDNCGLVIKNIAVVERDDGGKFNIGLDCMDTIVGMLPSQKQEARNTISRKRKFYKFLKTECKSAVLDIYPGYDPCYTLYKYVVTKWESTGVYRCPYTEEYTNLINKFNIPIITIKHEK